MNTHFGHVDFVTRYGFTFDMTVVAPMPGKSTSGSDAPAGIVQAVHGAGTRPLQDVRGAAELAVLMAPEQHANVMDDLRKCFPGLE